MFQTPITSAVNRVLITTKNGGLHRRVSKNRRTIASFSPRIGAEGTANYTVTTLGESSFHSQNEHSQHRNLLGAPFSKTAWNRIGGTAQNNNTQCRSMVTITQTKSTDSAPLFSSQVVDDVSSSEPAPTYVVNEDTNLIVTESCLKQVERLLKQRTEGAGEPTEKDGYFLRVFVDAGGCSGFQYQFEVDNELDEDEDIVVIMAKSNEDSGTMNPRVVVDETSMGFLEGSTIDYVIEMIKSAFVVTDNPQSESACGCGSSFAMKNFEQFSVKD